MKTISPQAMAISVLLLALVMGSLHADGVPFGLTERMKGVVLAGTLEPKGTTAEQQFGDVLQKMSARYAERWKTPLPVWIDLPLLTHLRTAPGLLENMLVPAFRDVPLDVQLRFWCELAGANYRVHQDAVFISLKKKPE